MFIQFIWCRNKIKKQATVEKLTSVSTDSPLRTLALFPVLDIKLIFDFCHRRINSSVEFLQEFDFVNFSFKVIDLMVELKTAFKVETLLSSEFKTLPKTAKKTIFQLSCDIVFDFCSDCYKLTRKMSSIPQGMFVAKKMRENQEKLTISRMNGGENVNSQKYFNTKLTELTPLKYNSKLMNSIWGLYNRYSPHNIKSTNDENAFGGDLQRAAVANLQRAAAPKEAADGPGKPPKTPSPTAAPKLESFWSNIPISQSQ